MGNTALHPSQPSATGRMISGQYLGVDAVLHFGDPAAELAALNESCGVFHLPWRAKITVTGKDRARWLHNMVTNNVRDLALNRGNYNFVLNAQGRILGDMYIYNRGESLLLDTDSTQVEPLLTAMKRYIIMDKVEMAEAPIFAAGLCGPKAEESMAAAGIDVRGMEPLEIREFAVNSLNVMVARGPENKPGWYEVWVTVPEDEGQGGFFGGRFPGAQNVGVQALEWWRILHGIPQYGQDIRDRDLPQETGQTQALNFTKGCYIGQEIVERIRSRGQVHRRFVGFEFEDGPQALGKHEAQGRTVAEVTSAATVPLSTGDRNVGLGYVRREAADAGPQIELGGSRAKVVELPFG
ncbi:MAG TPA: glycine cleavage T C-terminal barrel domain-containing protein [Candidatus Acidoferrales bacterium]|nr:glycine cleavage T C-terminal barrel domain-containing protein [Candidatus Acidoferrales bacterium]